MFIIGLVLWLIVKLVSPSVPLPDPIWPLLNAAGIILMVVGIVLFLLSFFGHPIGRGLGAGPRGSRYWY